MSQTQNRALPLGALAAGFGLSLVGSAWAQTAPETKAVDNALPEVTVKGAIDHTPVAKKSYQVETTTIGKGKQALRDIPQSITVVTEKLLTDRHLDTLKEALHSTAGVTFQAAEGGEEDIRLRGFSLQGTGDIFVDGMRDPAFYERDTFNYDRLELLRGSASMLFGRGSTGGAVNQVSKVPYLDNANQIDTTLGNHNYVRVTGDFNRKTSETSALRVTGMRTKADNNGAGSSINKEGLAGSFRWGIGSADEFQATLYYLDNHNGINYGMPWIKSRTTDNTASNTVINKLDPSAYYGMASDYNDGSATTATLTHQHKFSDSIELKSMIRKGTYTRDQRADTIRFPTLSTPSGNVATVDLRNFGPNTILNRGNQMKVQDLDTLYAQTDLSAKFKTGPVKHTLLSGMDYAKEEKQVYASGASTKPATTVGTPDDGARFDEEARRFYVGNQFQSESFGMYAQDLIQVAPAWKILAGVRYDHLNGEYQTLNSVGTLTGSYDQKIGKWSKRAGVLFQPTPLHSFHFSYGTSFNTSGDTYSYGQNNGTNAAYSNTPPESSENLELGAKLDTEDGRVSTRLAVFRATKNHERNTDATSIGADGSFYELSAKRHVTGFDMDVTGRITDNWEVYVSYTWLPEAKVDQASAIGSFGNRAGDRPGLTPKHSGTVWNTYSITPQWRVGGGVNFRSKQSPADVSTAGGPIWYAPGFATVDLMSDYVINQTFTIKANVSNVGNKLYADALYRGHYIPGAGRLVQISLSTKF